MAGDKTSDRLAALAAPEVDRLGLEIWDAEFVKEGSERYLRLYIDSPAGISSDDCEAVSRAIDPLLDEADIVDGQYIFEVCSPGIERRIRTDAHFQKMLGSRVRVRLFTAADGNREYIGRLDAADAGAVTLTADAGTVRLERRNIAACNAVFDF